MFKGYFDGASLGDSFNDAAIGVYIVNDSGEIIWQSSERIGCKSNTEAEYAALLVLLREVRMRNIRPIEIHGDNVTVINQVRGESKVRLTSPVFSQCAEAQKLIQNWPISLSWVPRRENIWADKLANKAFKRKAKEAAVNIIKVSTNVFLAIDKDGQEYAVDLKHENCSCDHFRESGTCEHMLEARKCLIEVA